MVMRRASALAIAAFLVSAALAACDESTQDLLSKTEAVTTKAELRQALGDPDGVTKVGPLETWTYKASNGEVSFLITGDAVSLKTASASSKK